MKYFIVFICFFIISNLKNVENAKILAMVPLPYSSHFVMYKTLLEALGIKGHEVDVVTNFTSEKYVAGLNYISVSIANKNVPNFTVKNLRDLTVQGIFNLMFGDKFCQQYFEKEEMKKIRDGEKKYDLIIVEMFVADCFFGFTHVFQAPVIAMTSSVNLPWGASRIGNPDNPAFIPNYFRDLSPEMTLMQRALNVFTLFHTKLIHHWELVEQDKVSRQFFGDNLSYLEDIVANTSLFIVNSHFSLNQARPNLPNVIEVAGLHIVEPKPLEKRLADIIGESKFIYFSLGSLANPETLSLEILESICEVFQRLPYKVLWKGDSKKFAKNLVIPENVHLEKWLPQMDVLCHPNALLFITHSGLMGAQEAVYCGVPMLSIPLFADQFLNSKNMVHRGIAIEINFGTELFKEEFYSSLKELIENPKYDENVKQLSKQFKDRPQTPLEEAVYWIEYVLRYKGAPQLKSRSAGLTWYQYHLVDVILIIILFLVLILGVIYLVLRSVTKVVCKRHHTKDKLS